jgi:hypothetical protein
MDVLDHLLRAPPSREPVGELGMWFDRLAACPFEKPIERALWAGFEADRLGYAFVGGYQAALARLLAWAAEALGTATHAWPPVGRLSLAATETGGGHPRAIETKLLDENGALSLRGEKTFATLASAAEQMLVVASRGADADGKNRLAVVRVRTNAPGVTIEDRAPTPFAPEIPHAKVKLADVVVSEQDVLPGDGYAIYLKPFRTIEDTHVLGATLGHVIATARRYGFDGAVAEGATALVTGLHVVTERSPNDPAAHVALAGLFVAARRLISEHDTEWNKTDTNTRDRWKRDLGLLIVAENARQQRTAAAWKTLSASALGT